MNKRNLLLFLLSFSLIIVLSGCGNILGKLAGGSSDEANGNETAEAEPVEEEQDAEPEEGPEKSNASAEMSENEVYNPAIAEETDADVEVIYTNNDANFVNDIDGFVITAEAYQIVKITDMNESTSNRFDGDKDGYIITTKASVDNTLDKAIQYNVSMNVQMEDRYDYVSSNGLDYIPEEHQLRFEKDEYGVFEAGERRDFWLTARMTTAEFDKLAKLEPKFIIEGNMRDAADEESKLQGDNAIFPFVYSKDQAKEVADAPDLYPDKLTTDNIAKKEIIFEDTSYGKSEKLDGFHVTVEGVQYAKLTPNESSKEMFENFDGDDVVAVTVYLNIDNQSKETISNMLSGWLVVNNGEAKLQSAGFVDNYSPMNIEKGQKGENYMVFVMKQKYYDIYDSFELELGPFLGDDGYAFKENKMTFELPSE